MPGGLDDAYVRAAYPQDQGYRQLAFRWGREGVHMCGLPTHKTKAISNLPFGGVGEGGEGSPLRVFLQGA